MSTTTLTPRQRLRAIRDALSAADQLLADAYAAEDWRALGRASWADYCAKELPQLRMIKLSRPERRAHAAAAAAAGLSAGAFATAYGIAKDTAWRDMRAAGDVASATVVSTDGARRARRGAPAVTTPPAAVRYTDQLVTLLRDAGPLTVADVCRRTRRHHGAASAALCRLAAAGRITYTPGVRRGAHGLYSAPTEG